MAKLINAKNYNLSYLYNKVPEYSKNMGDAILSYDRIDKTLANFEPVYMDVKRRQTMSVLINVLESDNVILLYSNKPLFSAFNVFAARDSKSGGKLKVFVDASTTLEFKDGFWYPKSIDKFIAQLVNATTYMIYYADPDRMVTNNRLLNDSTKAFVDLFLYILDYLRVSGFVENRDRIAYITSLYYLTSLCGKDINESSKAIAMKVSGLDRRHADIAEIFLTDPATQLIDINSYITFIASAFKLNDLTTEVFVDKWIYLFGPGYQFALELLPSFIRMITDTYSGTYINRQKNIEKVIGKSIVYVFKDMSEIAYSAKRK